MGILRFLLAMAVVLEHGGFGKLLPMTGGQLAVQTFFLISGFYMTLILDGKYSRLKSPYKVFISNRVLRLLPPYLAVLALTVIGAITSLKVFGVEVGTEWGGASEWIRSSSEMNLGSIVALSLSNLLLVGQDWIMFTGFDPTSGNLYLTPNSMSQAVPGYRFLLLPQAWTLGLELSFYLVAPFLVTKRWWTICLLICGSIALRCGMYVSLHLAHDPWTYRFFPFEIALFLMGCLACKAYKTNLFNVCFEAHWLRWVALSAFISATLFFQWIPVRGKSYLFLLLAAGALPSVFALTKDWKWDRRIGELSYPIYISHILVLSYVDLIAGPLAHEHLLSGKLIALLVGTLVISIGIHLLIERPIEKVRQRWIQSATSAPLPKRTVLQAVPMER